MADDSNHQQPTDGLASAPLQSPDQSLSEVAVLEHHIASSCPTEDTWLGPVYLYDNSIWISKIFLPAVVWMRSTFVAHDSDILVASRPKSGTTWLKALTFCTLRRSQFSPSDPHHPLLSSNPHSLVPTLESDLYTDPKRVSELANFTVPRRLMASHSPYHILPDSFHTSSCRVIYICRNPLDAAVSLWHFVATLRPEFRTREWTIEEMVDCICSGTQNFGPFWTHMLGYWNESLKTPDHVLFLKYEDLIADPISNLKKMAGFIGVPFSEEEEKAGVVEEIVKLCSLGKLKDLHVNKTGKRYISDYKNYFRKGEVGDWVNYFSPSMAERLQGVNYFSPSGKSLRVNVQTPLVSHNNGARLMRISFILKQSIAIFSVLSCVFVCHSVINMDLSLSIRYVKHYDVSGYMPDLAME